MEKEIFKKLYSAIYSVTAEISKLIELDDLDSIQAHLEVKDELIKKINEVKLEITLSEEEKEEFNSFIVSIKELENKNLKAMEVKREILKEKISSANKEHKTISSYNVTKENLPSIIDERE